MIKSWNLIKLSNYLIIFGPSYNFGIESKEVERIRWILSKRIELRIFFLFIDVSWSCGPHDDERDNRSRVPWCTYGSHGYGTYEHEPRRYEPWKHGSREHESRDHGPREDGSRCRGFDERRVQRHGLARYVGRYKSFIQHPVLC